MEAAQEGIKMAFTHFLDNRKSAMEQLHENALDYWKPLYDALHFERIYTGKSYTRGDSMKKIGNFGKAFSI